MPMFVENIVIQTNNLWLWIYQINGSYLPQRRRQQGLTKCRPGGTSGCRCPGRGSTRRYIPAGTQSRTGMAPYNPAAGRSAAWTTPGS